MKNVAIATHGSGLLTVTPLEERDHALIALARGCGLSAAAIARLDVASVDLEADLVRVARPGGAVRELPAAPATLRPVARYLERRAGVLAAGAPDEPRARRPVPVQDGPADDGLRRRRRLASVYTRIESRAYAPRICGAIRGPRERLWRPT